MAERAATSPSPMLEENPHVWLCTLSLNTIRSHFYREPQAYFQRLMIGYCQTTPATKTSPISYEEKGLGRFHC